MEVVGSPNHPPTVRELCEVDGWVGKDRYFISQVFKLLGPDAKGPLKSYWPNLPTLTPICIDKLLTVESVKGRCTPPLRNISWSDSRLHSVSLSNKLKDLRKSQHQLKDEVLSLTRDVETLRLELKTAGDKAITYYKASRGFHFKLEKMRQVTYEFRYRVALECFRAKYPNLSIEEDPLVEQPEDANVRIEVS
ncbi:hypothetical protein BHE74_00023841 [Ensete ventricosum]|nr:hypothetical protein GW17_00016959 [Ensete ventricosum]RWW68630.1 hypothetical protein BHE74_00023841 [Ensete ventricosum]RZR76224.1 hypothetical protein BHM03_00000877 [Ensete ventricosum]